MAGQDVTEVLIGTGDLYAAEITGSPPVFPVDPTTTPDALFIHVGYTDDGVAVEVDRTYEDVLVAETADPINVLKTNQAFRLVAALAQASLDNIKVALGGTITAADPVGFTSWVPLASTVAEEYLILFRTTAPGTAKARDFMFERCVGVGALAMQHAKAPAKTIVAIEFRVLVPSSGDIVKIRDED